MSTNSVPIGEQPNPGAETTPTGELRRSRVNPHNGQLIYICLNEKCSGDSRVRGYCASCYAYGRILINTGNATWENEKDVHQKIVQGRNIGEGLKRNTTNANREHEPDPNRCVPCNGVGHIWERCDDREITRDGAIKRTCAACKGRGVKDSPVPTIPLL